MFLQPDLFDTAEPARIDPRDLLNLPALIARIADISPRPRDAFIVLNLIAKAPNEASGSAGPYVVDRGTRVPLRNWLCDSLVPMAKRDARRLAIVAEVRDTLQRAKGLPNDPEEADRLVDEEVRSRVRRSGRSKGSLHESDIYVRQRRTKAEHQTVALAVALRAPYRGHSVDGTLNNAKGEQ